jgi:DNA-binding LacI/PurR family transcriptional regulator
MHALFGSNTTLRSITPFILNTYGQKDILARTDLFSRSKQQPDSFSAAYEPSRINEMATEVMEIHALRKELDPLLEQALSHKEISAWIASSDSTAMLCLDFLRRKNIEVPHRISVIGMDDGINAFLLRMSSYNFNGAAALEAMVEHIIAPLVYRPAGHCGGVIAFDGFITPRTTTSAYCGA